MYLQSILYFLTWPLLIGVSYFIITTIIKKIEQKDNKPPQKEESNKE